MTIEKNSNILRFFSRISRYWMAINRFFKKRLDVSSLLEKSNEFLSTDSVDNLVDNSQTSPKNPLPISQKTD